MPSIVTARIRTRAACAACAPRWCALAASGLLSHARLRRAVMPWNDALITHTPLLRVITRMQAGQRRVLRQEYRQLYTDAVGECRPACRQLRRHCSTPAPRRQLHMLQLGIAMHAAPPCMQRSAAVRSRNPHPRRHALQPARTSWTMPAAARSRRCLTKWSSCATRVIWDAPPRCMRDDAARPCNGRADLHMRRLLCPLTVRAARPPRSQRCAVEKPREP